MSALERPLVLGIETSCDDTACAVVDGSGRVLTSIVSSQIEPHRPYGGVVPEIASREHLRNWPAVSAEALERSGTDLAGVDVVAATRGPGLVGSLLVGLSLGKAIAYALGLPFHAVHHMEGHLFSPFLGVEGAPAQPLPERFAGLVVSGGHSLLLRVSERGAHTETVARTRDDAMGEVFDKIGKRIGLPFPGGALVDRLAESGHAAAHPLPIAMCGESLDFSFSGLKSRTLLDLGKLDAQGVCTRLDAEATEPEPPLLDLLAGFRAAAVDQLIDRVRRLHTSEPIEVLAVSGGAAANQLLRRRLETWAAEENVDLRLVRFEFSSDNAAMIAHAALLRHGRGLRDDPTSSEAESRIPL
jgi:N6-L-threonylcarbamoyladenine synthase